MPRRKRPDPQATFKAESFRLRDETRRELCDEYLVPQDSARVPHLAEAINLSREDEQKIESTLVAVQAWAIEKIEVAIGEYVGAMKSGNESLLWKRGKRGRPKQSARRRMVSALGDVLWLFYHGTQRGKPTTKKGWDRDRYEYLRLILDDKRINIKVPSPREEHANSELREWGEPVPRKWVTARKDDRREIHANADAKASHRNERAPWKMPPRVPRTRPRVCRVRPDVRRRLTIFAGRRLLVREVTLMRLLRSR